MKIKLFNTQVESFHFDVAKPEDKVTQDLQVALRRVEPSKPEEKAELKAGNMFQVMVPFTIVPQKDSFKIEGQITSIVQTLDYFGEAEDLAQADLEQASKPIVDELARLTFQITKEIYGQGYQLDFAPTGKTVE